MAFPTGEQIDIIATKILFDAKEALLQLKGWQNSIEEGANRTLFFKEIVKGVAREAGINFKEAAKAVGKFAKALGINPVLLRSIGKELDAIASMATKMGISFEEAQSRFGGFAIVISQGTTEIALFGSAFRSAISSGLPLLTAMQTALMAISTQLAIIRGQMSGFGGRGRGVPLLGSGGAGAGVPLLGSGGGGGVPLLGSGGGGAGGGGLDIIDAEWEEVGDSAKRAGKSMDGAADSAKKAGAAGKDAGDKTKSAFERAISTVNVLRIALGALVSMLIFQVIQAIIQLTREAIKEFTELEDSIWRIAIAEKALSQQGVEISVEGLKKGIEDIKSLLPIFSEQDIAGLIGKISISTKELGYTEEQILQLSKAIAVLNVVSTENEDLTQTASKVITALLSGTTKGISGLGVQLNDTVIKAKAVELRFIKSTDALEDLTKEQKDFAKLAIVLGTAEDSLGLIGDYLETNAAKLRKNNAAWDDFKTTLGGLLATGVPALNGLLEILTDAVNMLKAMTVFAITAGYAIANIKEAVTGPKSIVEALKEIPEIFDLVAKDQVPKLFAKMPRSAPQWFKDFFGEYLTDVDTATSKTQEWKDVLEDEDALKALEDLEDKIQDILLDAQQAREDLDIRLGQKEEDLDLEYLRKEEDAAIDHQDKLEDINQDALDKIEDAKRKAREEEERNEAELLQKLKELRQRFLLDLEDALHARDARQVLRLIREYKLDKQNLLDRAALEEQQRKDSLEEDLRNIEIERQRRIESENIEYQRKLADLAVAKQREQEELQIWYQREQDDIQRNIEQKLERLLAGYINEEKLHIEHQEEIQKILAKYVGEDMALLGKLTEFMSQQFAQIQALANAAFSASLLNNPYLGGFPAGTSSATGVGGGGRRAEGGTVIATRPTRAIFGERGPEMATFVPLGRKGADVGKVFGEMGGGMNGTITVSILLSPDLEGRVIERSMDGVAELISKVNNTRVR